MKVEYRIVDVEGDDVRYEFFEPWTEIPVKMRSVQFQNDHDPEGDGPTMIITLEYLHGDEGWSTFTEVKIDE